MFVAGFVFDLNYSRSIAQTTSNGLITLATMDRCIVVGLRLLVSCLYVTWIVVSRSGSSVVGNLACIILQSMRIGYVDAAA